MDMNKARRCHRHSSHNEAFIPDFTDSKLSRGSQTNQNSYVHYKTSRSAQAQSLYDCPSNIYKKPPVKMTEYYTEFPPQKKFCPYRGNFASCRYLDLTHPCKSSTLWKEKVNREHSPMGSLTEPFAVSLRQYSSERRNGSAHLLRKLLIYTQSRSSPKGFNIRGLRTAIKKSQSAHKDKLFNKKPQKKSKEDKETLNNIYRSNSCKNVGRETSRKPSPILNDNEAGNETLKNEAKVRHAKVGAGTKKPKPDLSSSYDYLQNSACSLYLPRGILDRTTEVRYLDDVTRCVKDTIKMLCESEKEEPCPTIASRYMQHLLEYHHRDAQAQANFERGTTDQKTSKKNWNHSLIDYDGASLCTASSPCRQDSKKCHFEPTCSFEPMCYFPDSKNDDEPLFPDGSVGVIVQEWMRTIPINANFSPTDKIIRDRIVIELTNNLFAIITEPNFENKARRIIFNYLMDLPMWLPEGEAQIKFKNQIVDNLINRLKDIGYIIAELKCELLRWVRNIDYEPRYDDGEIVTDCKIVNNMAERLQPLILNRPENEDVHKINLQRVIIDELLNIPLDVRDDFKCKVINNLANDLTSRLVWLNGDSGMAKKRNEGVSIRNIINDWMENIPVNPYFSQIDLELQEQLVDDLAKKLTKLRTGPDFETIGRDAILKFLNNLPVWWPGDDDKVFFINELASKLIYKLANPDISEEVENIVSRWARNIKTGNVDDVILRVLSKIVPIMSNRHGLDEGNYKSKLKRLICEELRNTPIDFKGENQSMVIDILAENLTNELLVIETNMDQKIMESNSDNGQPKTEYDEIQNIVNNWVKTLPVNHDFSMKEKQIRDEMAGDLAKKLTLIRNDVNIESKVNDAALQFLYSIPLWTPDDSGRDKFMIDMSNKLSDKILQFYSTEDELKRVTSKWADKVNHKPRDDNGNTIDKSKIIEKVIQKVRPLVLNRPDNDLDFNEKLKEFISEELRKFPLEVKPIDKNRVISKLAEDLAYNLVNLQPESTTSQKIEIKTRSSVLNDIVLKWLNDIPVKSNFKLEDDELRKELGEQLINKLTKLTDDSRKLMEIPLEAEAKKAALECLKNLPMKKPGPGKEDEHNKELVDKLLKQIKDRVSLSSLSRESKSDGSKRQSTSSAKEKISNDTKSSTMRESSDPGRNISSDSKNEKKRKSTDSSKGKSSDSSGSRRISNDSKGMKRKSNADDSSKMKSSDSSGDVQNSRDLTDDKKRKSNASDTGRKRSSDSSGVRRKSRESAGAKKHKSNASDIGNKKSTDSSGYRKSRDDKRKSGDSRTEKLPKSNSSDIGRGKSSESSGDRRKSRASDAGRNNSMDTKRSKERKSSDSKNAEKRHSSRVSGAKTNLPKRESKSGGSFSDRSDSPKQPPKLSDASKNKSIDTKRSKSISSNSNERKSIDLKNADKRHKSRVSGANSNLPKRESKSEGSFSDRSISPKPDGAKRKSRNSKSQFIVSSELSVDEKAQKKVFDILKDNSLFAHLSPEEEVKAVKNVTDKLNELPNNGSVEMKKFIDEAVSEWIDILEKKAMERHFRENITKCFKIVPEISKALDKKLNQNLIHELASSITDYETGSFSKTDDAKIKAEVKKIVENIFKNENIAAKKHPVEMISQNIVNAMHRVKKHKSNLKQSLESEITQWIKSIPEISNAAYQNEHKRALKKLIYDIQMLAARKSTDSVVMNRIQEKITLFLETVLQKENVIIDQNIKKKYKDKLLNHIIFLINQNKKKSESVNTLKSELSFCLVDVPLFKNALCSSRGERMTKIFHILLGLYRYRVNNDRENFVQNVVSEFITETIEKSCGSMSAQTKSILESELCHKLNITEYNNHFDNEKKLFELSEYDPGLSNKLDTLKLLIEEIIRNNLYFESGLSRGWIQVTEDDEAFYHDMTHQLAEILKNKFFMAYRSIKDEINDYPKYLRSLIHKKRSPVDQSIVDNLTRELMADVNIKLETKRNKILKHLLKQSSEDDELYNYFDSSTEKFHDLKNRNYDNLIFTEVTSDDETHSKKNKIFSNQDSLKGRSSGIKQIYNTSRSLYKTYDNEQNEYKSANKDQEHTKKSVSPSRSHATRLFNQENQSGCKDFSNRPIISGRYTESVNDKFNKEGNLKSSHPPSTSQSSEDLSNNTYSLRKYILKERSKQPGFINKKREKSSSPIRKTPSSPESSDDSPIEEEKIISIIRRHLYKSHLNDTGVFNVVPYMNRPSTSKIKTKVRGLDQTGLEYSRFKETNKPHLLQRNRNPLEKKYDESYTKKSRGKSEHFEDKPRTVSETIDNKTSKNVSSTKSNTVTKGITDILVRRVGLNYKEARKFADLLIEKTNNIYRNDYGTINAPIESITKNLKHEIKHVLKSFHVDHMLDETEKSIINLLTNQVIAGKVNDNVRTSLMNILAEVDENIAAKVADSLLDHVNKVSFTVPPESLKRKPMAKDKRNPRQQFLTALSVEDKSSLNFEEKSLASEDKKKYLEVRKDIVDFVKEKIPSPTPSMIEIIDTATDDLLRIYINSKENKGTSTEDLESVVRREIKNFLLILPIETDESKNDLIDEIATKLQDVDSIIRSSSGETTSSSFSRNLSLIWTHEQQEAFLRETKKMLSEVLEENAIDVSQAKHLALELDDKLMEIISSKTISNPEKLEQMKNEFFQCFRNLPSLSSFNIAPEDLTTQVIDRIPNIITKLATDVPREKDFIKETLDFIKAKTGDITPRFLQQMQAQVEDVMAVTKSILEDSDMTPHEKSDAIKLGFLRLMSEIPKQSNETAEQLASELYDKIFGPSGAVPTTPSPSLTSSNEDVMIIRNNEARYLNQLMNIIRNWTDEVPMISDEINDTNLKDDMARDLAKDITDRQKYIQLNKDAKTSDEDELEYLKYQVFRWLNRTLDVNDLSPFVNDIEDLMEQIRRVPIFPLVKPSNKLLEDEIAKWVEQIPCNRITPKGNSRKIKELADKIQRHRGKPHSYSKIDSDIHQFIRNIFKEDETTLKALAMQLKTFLKNQGLLKGTNVRSFKTGAEDLYELVEDWCRDLPIYLGDSPEEQEKVKTIKQNINSKLINKIGELNMNPQILNDDFLYEDLLLDEVDKLLTKVPRNPELEKYLPALKRDLISRVKGARQKIKDEQAGHVYIQQLRDNIATSALMPEPLYPDEIISFEILRENLVDAFINLHFVTDNEDDEIKFKRKISDEISRFCNDYLRRHPCTPIDQKLLSRQLYRALQAIPIPKDESMRSEIEELKIKEILYEWVKEIPLKDESGSELLQRNKTISVLAKRLREIEKEKESNIKFNNERGIREEITKWLRRNPFKVGRESEVPKTIEKIVEKLKKPEQVLDFSISFADDCSCLQNKPVIPPCSLSPEDRAHLKRIRDKYNSPCITGKSSLTIDSCSQTIEPQTLCPNLKTQDRFPICPSNQPPFPCPAMMSSASPYEMHQYPNVNVKNYVWDSRDSQMSTQTPRVPCQSKTPNCIQKQMSTQQPLPDCNSVSSQVCPEYEPVIRPRSSAFKCSQSSQARPTVDIPCSTPKTNRFIDSQDSDEEDSSSEDYKCSPCRPVINSGVCRVCGPSGALYSSFVPRKSKKKGKKKRSSEELEFPKFLNTFEPCGKDRRKQPCSCKERNFRKKGDKFFCYRASKTAEDDFLGHSEAECPHPTYMYFRN